MSPGKVTPKRWVTAPPKEAADKPAEGSMVWNCVLYQNLLFRPWGNRKAAVAGPNSTSPRAATSNCVRPPKSVTACHVEGSSKL